MITAPPLFISNAPEDYMKDFIKRSVDSFFTELNWYIQHNDDPNVLNYGTEATLCSLFTNGIVRNDADRRVSALQEYSCFKKDNCNGRADCFIRLGKTGIWVETKYYRNTAITDDHWRIPEWLEKEAAYFQVLDYYDSEKHMINNTYDAHYILTLCFKLRTGEPENLKAEAVKELSSAAADTKPRAWYYALDFIDKEVDGKKLGLEVYGSYESKSK
jgi:hypothetical protein